MRWYNGFKAAYLGRQHAQQILSPFQKLQKELSSLFHVPAVISWIRHGQHKLVP